MNGASYVIQTESRSRSTIAKGFAAFRHSSFGLQTGTNVPASQFPSSPYAPLMPEQRWFPADEELRRPPTKSCFRRSWPRSATRSMRGETRVTPARRRPRVALLRWWFETEHLLENADGSLSPFRYYFAQREAVETVIWLYDVRARAGQVRPAALRRFGRGVRRHVRRGLAALRAEDGDRRGQDQSALAAHRVELLSQALRAGLDALAQLPRHRAQHHRPRPPARRLRRPAHFLQRSRPARQRPRRPQLARRFPAHAAHPGRRARRPRDRQHLPDQHPSRLPRRRVATRRSKTTTCATTSSLRSARSPSARPPTARPTWARSSAKSTSWPSSTTRRTTSTTRGWPGSSPSRTSTTGCCRRTAAWRCKWT